MANRKKTQKRITKKVKWTSSGEALIRILQEAFSRATSMCKKPKIRGHQKKKMVRRNLKAKGRPGCNGESVKLKKTKKENRSGIQSKKSAKRYRKTRCPSNMIQTRNVARKNPLEAMEVGEAAMATRSQNDVKVISESLKNSDEVESPLSEKTIDARHVNPL